VSVAELAEKLDGKHEVVFVGNVLLVSGDAREVLKEIDDESVGLIFTDPPYGLGYADYDNSSEVFFELEEELYRIASADSFLVFWWNTKKLFEAARLKKFYYCHQLIAFFPATRSKVFVGDRKYAPIFVFAKGKPRVRRKGADVIPTGEIPVVASKVKAGDFKPTLTNMFLLSMFADADTLVLDPFAGYGSIPLTCKFCGIPCVAVEKDPVRFKIMAELLKNGKVEKSIPEMTREVKKAPPLPLFGGMS